MKNFLKTLASPLVLGTLAVLAISVMVWWIGPLIAIASARPLESVGARIVLLVLVWLSWLGRVGWLMWRRKKANAAILRGISEGVTATDREANVLAQRFDEAISKLREASVAKQGRKLLGNNPLYELPWYVFIGAPGSGKTTALINAGLNFVLGDNNAAVKGIGGTRNCDWWFTQDAVLIDTAGRYTLQDSDREVDSAAWGRFLDLLRKTRPRRPINGVLLTINVQDLLQQNADQRREHAIKLRTRLQELHTKLGVRVPVYVLITKADLIAGFNETFEPMGKEEREQVWGFTFPVDATLQQAVGAFPAEWDALQERLTAGQVDRLQAESDPARRAAIFGFPMEFASLKAVTDEFLKQVFNTADPLFQHTFLRGFYLTSGTQEGTPIDRAMGALSRSFGLERKAPVTARQKGRSYFLHRLMNDLVFRESHLVSFNQKVERQRKVLRLIGFAAIGVTAAALVVGWTLSFTNNRAYEQTVSARLPELKRNTESLPPATSGDPVPLQPVLSQLRDAAKPLTFALNEPPLLHTMGLYQGPTLDAAAQIAYRKLLDNALLPRMTQRLEERLRAANKDNLEQAYEALKAYVMVYTPQKYDAQALKAWISLDWDTQFKNLPPEQRAELDLHLGALLAQGAPQRANPMDTALVSGVRDMLASFPLEYRIYSRLKRRYRADIPEFTVASAAGPNAAKVFERSSGAPLGRGIPGLFSRAGYQKAFAEDLENTTAQLLAEEPWVLGRGDATATNNGARRKEISGSVRRLYLQDYISVWDSFLADVRLVRLDSLARSMEVARALASPDSPLAAFFRAVAKETSLVPPPKAASPLDKVGQAVQQAKSDLERLADPQAQPTGGGVPEQVVDDHFASVRRMVQGQPAPVDEATKLFADVYAQLQAIDAAQKSKSPPPAAAAGGGERAKAAAVQMPEPMRSMVETLADAGTKQGRMAERESLTGELKPLYDFCARAIANRYPFASGSKADVMPDDFGQFFGVGGMLDDFYQRRLSPLVDTGAATWAYRPLADGTRPASPAALADFQRASRIKDVFFRTGGRSPAFRVDIRPLELADGLKELSIDIDGQVTKFQAGNPSGTSISWPSQRVSSQIQLNTVPAGQTLVFDGPWALFRMFDRFEVAPSKQPERFTVTMNLDGRRARLEVIASSAFNPFRMREMQQFRCPGAL